MQRRDILRRCGGLGSAVGLGLLAGCSGGGDSADEDADLSVANFDYREGDDGTLVVTVTVENSGRVEGSGDLYVTAEAAEPTTGTETAAGTGTMTGTETTTDDGDDTVAAREMVDVTVPAGETTTVEVPFAFTVARFERDGSLDVDLRD